MSRRRILYTALAFLAGLFVFAAYGGEHEARAFAFLALVVALDLGVSTARPQPRGRT